MKSFFFKSRRFLFASSTSTSTSTAEKKNPKMIRKLVLGTFIGSYGYYQWEHYERNMALAKKLDIPFYKVLLYKAFPFSAMSSFAGWIGNIKIESLTLRKQLFGWYSKIYGCNLEEASKPLEDYESFSEFFARNLKWNARKIERVNGLVSACDGTLLHCGQLTVGGEGKGKGIYPEQVKGSLYPLKDLIGDEAVEKISKKSTDSDKSLSLYYCTIYLAPGDYHRFHAPAKMKIESIKKFSGEVLSVAPWMIKLVPKLFCMNERIAINGRWKHGFISYVPVGAANVGSIVIDPEIETKKFIEAGKEIGHFELGSTVVLIFEAPKNSKWQFSPGDRVQLGMPLIEVPKSSWFF